MYVCAYTHHHLCKHCIELGLAGHGNRSGHLLRNHPVRKLREVLRTGAPAALEYPRGSRAGSPPAPGSGGGAMAKRVGLLLRMVRGRATATTEEPQRHSPPERRTIIFMFRSPWQASRWLYVCNRVHLYKYLRVSVGVRVAH